MIIMNKFVWSFVLNRISQRPTVALSTLMHKSSLKELTNSVINIPKDIPFLKSLQSTQNIYMGERECKNLVDIDVFINEIVHIIKREIGEEDSQSYRKKPIIVCRLSRGGKTTALVKVFDVIKDSILTNNDDGVDRTPVNAMIISFNTYSDFIYREGESQKQAILRVIATPLVDQSLDSITPLEVDEAALDSYIGSTPFVLFIDEIHFISRSKFLDKEASTMLKRLFLKKNRYLMMTTHIPMGVDSYTDINRRGYHSLPQPCSFDLVALRNMGEGLPVTNPERSEAIRWYSFPHVLSQNRP